jgi:predicted alpha/beta hydrolase
MMAAPNASQLVRLVLIGVHTGYFGDYRRAYRFPMALVWHGFMPLMTRIAGYFPASWFKLGHDIPAGIARQWAGRRSPSLAGEGARADAGLARCAELSQEALVVSVTDDAFATKAGTQRLLSYMPGLRTQTLMIRPRDVAMKKIGHFGYFRRSAESRIWPAIVRWIVDGTLSAVQPSDPALIGPKSTPLPSVDG